MRNIWNNRSTLEKICIAIICIALVIFLLSNHLIKPLNQKVELKKLESESLIDYTPQKLVQLQSRLRTEEKKLTRLNQDYCKLFGSLKSPESSSILQAHLLVNDLLNKYEVTLMSRSEKMTVTKKTRPRRQGQIVQKKNSKAIAMNRYPSLTRTSFKYHIKGDFTHIFALLKEFDKLPLLCDINSIEMVKNETSTTNKYHSKLDLYFELGIYSKKKGDNQ